METEATKLYKYQIRLDRLVWWWDMMNIQSFNQSTFHQTQTLRKYMFFLMGDNDILFNGRQ